MGQGHYYGIIYGIIDKELIHFGSTSDIPINAKLLDELSVCKIKSKDADEGYGIRCCYESKKDYVGIFVAITDSLLSKWWGCGHIKEIEMGDVQKWTEKNFPDELKKAQTFWRDKIEPILAKYFYAKHPALHFVKDYD